MVSDGIGGTKTVTWQILNVRQMFDFCTNKIKGIQFHILEKDDLSKIRTFLKPRFAQGRTLPGTRSFHHFIPVDTNTISYKRISGEGNMQT